MQIPIDIWTSLECKDWINNFSWPIKRNEIILFRHKLESELKVFLDQLSEQVEKKILKIIFHRLIIEYLSIFEVLLLIKRMKDANDVPVYHCQHPLWNLASGILNKGVPENPIFFLNNYSIPLKMKLIISIKNSLIYQVANRDIDIFKKHNHIVQFSPSPIINEIAKLNNKRITSIDINSYFPNNKILLKQLYKDLLSNLTEKLTSLINDCYKQHGVKLNKAMYNYLTCYNSNILSGTLKYYQWLSKKKLNKLLPALYTVTGKNYHTRILGTVIKEKGGDLICCDHGEGHGIYDDTEEGYGELGIANKYIVFTNGMGELYRNGWPRMIRLQEKMPEIIVSPIGSGPITRNIFQNNNNSVGGKIDKILYVAGAFINNLTPIECRLPDMVYLEWQHFLFKTLNQAGFQVLCKYHPETILDNKKFEPFDNVEYLNGNYEDYLESVDLFIFDYSQTSALPIGLCTNKPVILIDNGFPKLYPEVRQSLSRRCKIVNGYFDDNNRFRVDDEELIEAIESSQQNIDYDYVYKYVTGKM